MKVKELIENLSQFNPEAEVLVDGMMVEIDTIGIGTISSAQEEEVCPDPFDDGYALVDTVKWLKERDSESRPDVNRKKIDSALENSFKAIILK